MSTTPLLRLGTRGSQLALYQAHAVARLIGEAGGPACEIVIIRTTGDQLQDAPLSDVGGKRLFVKEIEDALMAGTVDLAVHSSKDLPAVLPEGLVIAGVLPREDARDAVVLPWRRGDDPLSSQASRAARTIETLDDLIAALGDGSIGTSSVRRIAQLTRLLPRATFAPIRGNLDTRLRKLDAGEHDALVLAAAGLCRLGFAARISLPLPVDVCVPAPGQGIIAIEIRQDDDRASAALTRITDQGTAAALTAERALVEALGGGCQTPIGALASPTATGDLGLLASVVSIDGSQSVEASGQGPASDAEAIGRRVAAQLIARGASAILDAARRPTAHNLSRTE